MDAPFHTGAYEQPHRHTSGATTLTARRPSPVSRGRTALYGVRMVSSASPHRVRRLHGAGGSGGLPDRRDAIPGAIPLSWMWPRVRPHGGVLSTSSWRSLHARSVHHTIALRVQTLDPSSGPRKMPSPPEWRVSGVRDRRRIRRRGGRRDEDRIPLAPSTGRCVAHHIGTGTVVAVVAPGETLTLAYRCAVCAHVGEQDPPP
jgi:hypothetical protein